MQLLGESSSMGSSCLKSKTLSLLGRIPLGDIPPALQHLQIPRSRHILCKCLEKLCLESSRLLLPEAQWYLDEWILGGWHGNGFHSWRQNVQLFLYLFLLTPLSSSFLFILFPSFLSFSSSYAQNLHFQKAVHPRACVTFGERSPLTLLTVRGPASLALLSGWLRTLAAGDGPRPWWMCQNTQIESDRQLQWFEGIHTENFAPPRWVQVLSETASLLSFTPCPGAAWRC